jgi:hypothetical protein
MLADDANGPWRLPAIHDMCMPAAPHNFQELRVLGQLSAEHAQCLVNAGLPRINEVPWYKQGEDNVTTP